jgi:hypothetical protein
MQLVFGLVACLGVASVGCGTLDTQDQVHDLRLLAMRAEPPEQVFYIDPASLDGGTGELPPNLHVQDVRLLALVADPKGDGRAVHFQFATCARIAAGTNDSQCLTTDPTFEVLAEGDATPRDGWAELGFKLTPTLVELAQTQSADPYQGFGFLPLYVQLTIKAGTETAIGFKRVLFTAAFDAAHVPTANQNPVIPFVSVAGHLWGEDEVVQLGTGPYDVAPDPANGLQEAYTKPTFEGGTLSFTESWRYNFFATSGQFDSAVTGGVDNFLGSTGPVDDHWSPNEATAQDATFFIVVRDGRGGESWAVRKAHLAP